MEKANWKFKKVNLTNVKSAIDKLDINKLENIIIGLNSLKSKVDNLDVDRLKIVPADLEKLSDVVE